MNHPLHAYGRERLNRVQDDDIASQLHPMLSLDDRPAADALRVEAWRVVGPFVSLSEREREYTDKVQRGELELELLLPDEPDVIARLKRHPALLWKIKNAREHKKSRGRQRR